MMFHTNIGQTFALNKSDLCFVFLNTALVVIYVLFLVPLEMDILRGEYFNRWYNLGPYIFSILAVELPFQVNMTCA